MPEVVASLAEDLAVIRQHDQHGLVEQAARAQRLHHAREQLVRVDDAAVVHVLRGSARLLDGQSLAAELLAGQGDADLAQIAVRAIRELEERVSRELVIGEVRLDEVQEHEGGAPALRGPAARPGLEAVGDRAPALVGVPEQTERDPAGDARS